jgi:hypothetical protein
MRTLPVIKRIDAIVKNQAAKNFIVNVMPIKNFAVVIVIVRIVRTIWSV